MTSLQSLPDELLVAIAALLSDDDLMSLRHASRKVERASFDHFAKRFFRKKGFLITTDSLDVLESIASHQGLKAYVQHVWFNPDCFTFVRHTQDSTAGSKVIDRYHDDHAALLHGFELHGRLESIFQRLSNLKTLGMRRGIEHKPWGWARLQYAAGQDPRILGRFALLPAMIQEPSLLLVAMLKALARSETQVRRFYTDAIIEKAAAIHLSRDELRTACNTIHYLEINLVGLLSRPQDGGVEDHLPDQPGDMLQGMLQAMPELRELGMTLFHDLKQRHMVPPVTDDLQSWRNAYPFRVLQHLSQRIALTHLYRVKLEKICTTSSALVSLLSSSSDNLMSLKLRHIHLLSEPSSGPAEVQRPWQSVFSFLANSCTALEYVLFHMFSEDGTTVRFRQDPDILAPDHPRPAFMIPALGSAPSYAAYDNLTVEILGREDVHQILVDLIGSHWSGTRLRTYPMDDTIWHTDTSDEDW